MIKTTSLFFLVLFFIYSSASSETFIVADNADSGPGTLREALILAEANGTSETDYIHFNLPGTSREDRSILLKSALPNVSSNLIIDGTTQPGSAFGVTAAKIVILPDLANYLAVDFEIAAFVLKNVHDVEFYGLYITEFINQNQVPQSSRVPVFAAFLIQASKRIKIGEPGKGNLLYNNTFTIHAITMSNNILNNGINIKSNIIGFGETGIKSGTNAREEIIIEAENSSFGGEFPLDGNIMEFTYMTLRGNSNKISSNNIGIDTYGTIPLSPQQQSIAIEGTDIEIANNKIGALFFILHRVFNFRITGNQNITGAVDRRFFLHNCENGVFGGEGVEMNLLPSPFPDVVINSTNSKNIQILKNSFSCTLTPYKIIAGTSIPNINVLVNNDTEYSGVASPNSEIFIYYDNTNCAYCNPVVFYTKVMADASGNWKITGDFRNKKWVANATFLNNSSEFTQPSADRIIPVTAYKHAYCGLANGSIKLTNVQHVIRVEWYNENNQKVGEGEELTNVGPGKYYARCYNGNCYVETLPLTILNQNFQISTGTLNITQPTCNSDNGSIRGLKVDVQDIAIYEWKDENNIVVSNGSDLQQAGPGKYTLFATINGCTKSYGPIILLNQSGITLNQTAVIVQPANCGKATGAITNIEATGTGILRYSWKNESQNEVAATKDLLNVPPGKYTLEVADESMCAPVFSTAIEVPPINRITIDPSAVIITPASCTGSDGQIINLHVTGATTFEWLDEGGSVFTTTSGPELTNAPAGKYRLRASNGSCSELSAFFTITKPAPIPFPPYPHITTFPCLNRKGLIKVLFGAGGQPASVRWVDVNGATIGTGSLLDDLDAGTYRLYLTDANGCESLFKAYNLPAVLPVEIEENGIFVENDQCGKGQGSIKGVAVANGKGPFTYTWTNDRGEIVGSSPDLISIKAGIYTLQVSDSTSCSATSSPFTVTDQTDLLPILSYKNVQICAPGDAFLIADQAYVGRYKLFETISGGTALEENESGVFRVSVSAAKDFFISYGNGTCETARTPVPVEVSASDIKFTNSFTPNADGINDVWALGNIENYPEIQVRIFNRYGLKVFESKGYSVPFDGKRDGADLPSGTYYYIIELRKGCNPITGSLTMMR